MNIRDWIGHRAHVFQKPYTREEHEGVAYIVSVDLSRQEGTLFPCEVRFVDSAEEPVVWRLVDERDLLPTTSSAPWEAEPQG